MRFCRNIIDCYTHGNRSCFTHKCRASSVFPLLTISIFSLCSFPIQGFFCAIFSFLLLDLLLLDLTESHACELYWHSVSKPYCILFLSETCSPAWVPIFLSDRNRFLILGSIQWIWLLDVCSYFHSSSCIYGCAAGTSVWFLRHYLLDWWKGKKKGENGCLLFYLKNVQLSGTKQSLCLC